MGATGRCGRSADGPRPQHVRDARRPKHRFVIPQSRPLRAGTARAPSMAVPGFALSALAQSFSFVPLNFGYTFPVMLLEFTKMNGAGNDFVLIDNRAGKISLTREQIV